MFAVAIAIDETITAVAAIDAADRTTEETAVAAVDAKVSSVLANGTVEAAVDSVAAKVRAEIAIANTIVIAIAIAIVRARTRKIAIAAAIDVADANPMSSGGKYAVGVFSAAANTMDAAARLLLPKVWLCSRECFSFVFGNALAAETVSAIVFAIGVAADIAVAVELGIELANTVIDAAGIIIDHASTFVSSVTRMLLPLPMLTLLMLSLLISLVVLLKS